MAMGRLAQTLDSLQLQQDGRPDVEARMREMDSLLRHLTSSEIRRLKIQLNTFANDICVEFPLELLLCITQHLDLGEVIALRSVSHKWNEIFSSAGFCLGIIKTHFRPVWEKHYRCLNADQKILEKEVLLQWLPGAIRDRIRRQHGHYQSMSILPQEHRFFSSDWQYKNGRIAYRDSHSAIAVRDIRTNLTATYMDENRLDLGNWHLSDEFLLAAKHGPISLNAWPLTYPPTRSHESIRLPARVIRISARQNQVGIITAAYDVLIWSIGGALISVDTSAVHQYLPDFLIRQELVVFHPLEQSCLFVICEAWPEDFTSTKIHTCRIVVQEFIGGRATTTKLLDLNLSTNGSLDLTGLLHDGVIGIHKSFRAQPSTVVESNISEPQTHSRFGQNETNHADSEVFTMVMFDIYQRSFVLEDYCVPLHHQNQVLERVFYWRNQVFLGVYGNPAELKGPLITQAAEDSLIAFNQHQHHASPRNIPYRFRRNEIHHPPTSSTCDIAYYWVGNADYPKDEVLDDIYHALTHTSSTGGNVIRRDDDYVVLQHWGGWFVWCFDKGVQLPVGFSLSS